MCESSQVHARWRFGLRSCASTSDDIIVAARAPWAMASSSAASMRSSLTAKITCSTGSGRVGERSKARHTADRLVARVDREQRAIEFALEEVGDRRAADGSSALGRAHHGDGAGTEQGFQAMRHVSPEPRGGQKSAAGVARRRGGSKNTPSTTRHRAITRDHLSSRW